MKTILKNIPKKALSLVISLAVILCSLGGTLITFAEATENGLYNVTDASPAIPMFVNTKLDLGDITVELENRSVYCGNTLDWSFVNADDNNGSIKVDNNAKTITAYTDGTYKLIAENDESSNIIYVIVNKKTGDAEVDYAFNLVNLDFENGDKFDQDKWVYSIGKGEKPSSVSPATFASEPELFYKVDMPSTVKQSNRLKLGGYYTNYMVFYTDDILSDFRDYDFSANVDIPSSDDSANNINRGFILRANINKNVAYYVSGVNNNQSLFKLANDSNDTHSGTGLVFAHYPYGSVSIGGIGKGTFGNQYGENENSYYLWGVEANTYHSLGTSETDSAYKKFVIEDKGGEPDDAYMFNDGNAETIRNFNIQLQGDNVKYTLDNKTLLDTTQVVYRLKNPMRSNTAYTTDNKEFDFATAFSEHGVSEAGNAIGFEVVHATMYIYSVNVKLLGIDGAEDIPVATEVEGLDYYEVTDRSPAVPMFAGTKVSLADIRVELEGGSKLLANALTWTPTETYTGVEISNGYITAKTAGSYKFTVNKGEAINTVYIMVNEYGNYDFEIVSYNDFSEEAFNANWVYAIRDGKTPTSAEGVLTIKPSDHNRFYRVEIPNTAIQTNCFRFVGNRTNYLLFYTNPILSDFADYVFSSNVIVTDDYHNNSSRGFVLRANINPNAEIYDTTNATASSIFTLPGDTDTATGTGLYFVNHPYGGITVGAYGQRWLDNSTATGTWGNYNKGFHTLGGNYDDFKVLDNCDSFNKNYLLTKTTPVMTNRTVDITVIGNDVKYTLDKTYTVLDTINNDTVYQISNATSATTQATSDVFGYDAAFAERGVSDAGNAIGFVLSHNEMNIYSFSVKLAGIEGDNDMPKFEHEITHKVSLNSKSYLPSTILNSEATWQVTENEYFEIYDTGVIVALKTGSATVNCTIIKDGEEIEQEVTIFVTEYNEDAYTHIVETDKAVIEKVSAGNYTITFDDDFELDYSGLTINGSAKIRLDELKVNPVATGKAFTFNVADYGAENLQNIKVKFATGSQYIYNIGASTKLFDDGILGLRFTSRIPAIKYGGNEEGVDYGALDNTLTVDGNTVTPIIVGTLVCPEILVGNRELALSNDDIAAIVGGDDVTTVAIGNQEARNVIIEKLADTTAAYSDFNVVITQIPDNLGDAQIMARGYIIYQDGNTYGVVYSDETVKNYSTVTANAAKPVQPLNVVTTDPADYNTGNDSDKIIITWGASCTQSTLSASQVTGVRPSYPAYLAENLGTSFKVFNAGAAGETAKAIMSRANVCDIYLQYDISFEEGSQVSNIFFRGVTADMTEESVGSMKTESNSTKFINCWVVDGDGNNVYYTNSKNNLPITRMNGSTTKVAKVIIDGKSYILEEINDFGSAYPFATNNIWGAFGRLHLRRTDGSTEAIKLTAGSKVTFDYSDFYDTSEKPYCVLVQLGGNGVNINATEAPEVQQEKIQSLMANVEKIVAISDRALYLVPHYWSYDATDDYAAKFGEDKIIPVRHYMLDDVFEDYDIIPTERDIEYMNETGMIAPQFWAVDNGTFDPHFTAIGYKVVADLAYQKGVALGYWK